jgi:predicted enzyme related to lactoylglutathione lyase
MANPVTWFEINGPNPEATAGFYTELFGWHAEQVLGGSTYMLIDTLSGSGINGGLGATEGGQAPHALFYVENADIESLLEKAVSTGSTSVVPVTETDMVTFAQFTDPFGNLIGLVRGEGTTNVSAGDNAPVDWFELSCTEPERAWDYYRALFGWVIEGDMGGQFVHAEVDAGGGIRGGIGSSPDGQPHVALYASVDDVQKYLERAESLGAEPVMPPTKVDEHTTIAAFVDPQGTTFGIYASED